jgi:hypothetical protein
VLTEYALDIDLTDVLAANAAVRAARDAAIDSVFLVNDIFSFHKEIQTNEARNGIWILMRERKLDLQAAVDLMADLSADCERRFLDAREGAAGTGRTDIEAYLTELEHLMSGNLEFHKISARYYPPDFAGDRFSSGDIVISRFRNLGEVAASGHAPVIPAATRPPRRPGRETGPEVTASRSRLSPR